MTPPTSTIERICDRIAFTVERLLAIALLIGIGLNFINSLGRYLTGFTINGADEIEIYILIWIAFLGAAVVTWRREHLRMDVIVNACGPAVRKAVAVVEAAVLIAIAAFVCWQSLQYVQRLYNFGSVSDIAHVPTWMPHSAVFVCFGLMALVVAIQAMRGMTGRETPREPGAVPAAERSGEAET